MKTSIYSILAINGQLFCRSATREGARRIFARSLEQNVRINDVFRARFEDIKAPYYNAAAHALPEQIDTRAATERDMEGTIERKTKAQSSTVINEELAALFAAA